MSVTIDRLAHLMQKEISLILQREAKDNKIGYVTITEVKVTKDLSYATVYYTVLSENEERIKVTDDALKNAKGFIRTELARKISVRKMPELVFKYDEALAYGNKINKLLHEIKDK